jgi:hypothetical protein
MTAAETAGYLKHHLARARLPYVDRTPERRRGNEAGWAAVLSNYIDFIDIGGAA